MCDVGAGSPQQSLVTLVSWQQAQPTNPTTIREEQTSHSRQEHNQQTQQEAKQERGNKRHTKKQQAAKRAEKAEERTGTRGKTAGGGQQQGQARGARGRKQGQEEEAAQAEEKGACSSSGVLRGDLDQGEYLSAGRKGTGTALATWCRGQSPTQGRSLCCHEEK